MCKLLNFNVLLDRGVLRMRSVITSTRILCMITKYHSLSRSFNTYRWRNHFWYATDHGFMVLLFLRWRLLHRIFACECNFLYNTSFIERIMTLLFSCYRLLQVHEDGLHTFRKEALLPFIIPILMYLTSNRTVIEVAILFGIIAIAGGTHFSTVGINAAHHHPKIFHDGDKPR